MFTQTITAHRITTTDRKRFQGEISIYWKNAENPYHGGWHVFVTRPSIKGYLAIIADTNIAMIELIGEVEYVRSGDGKWQLEVNQELFGEMFAFGDEL